MNAEYEWRLNDIFEVRSLFDQSEPEIKTIASTNRWQSLLGFPRVVMGTKAYRPVLDLKSAYRTHDNTDCVLGSPSSWLIWSDAFFRILLKLLLKSLIAAAKRIGIQVHYLSDLSDDLVGAVEYNSYLSNEPLLLNDNWFHNAYCCCLHTYHAERELYVEQDQLLFIYVFLARYFKHSSMLCTSFQVKSGFEAHNR